MPSIFSDDESKLKIIQELLDERDRAAMARLEIRLQIAALSKADADIAQRLSDIRAAGRVFGQAIAALIEPKFYESREALDAEMSKRRSGKPWVPGQSLPKTADEAQSSLTLAAENEVEPRSGRRISDLVLNFLEKAGSVGSQVGPIRQHLEKDFQITSHEKTVGMTLYRLSKDGKVYREGRTWFFVPPKGGKEDPGGETPGLTEMLK